MLLQQLTLYEFFVITRVTLEGFLQVNMLVAIIVFSANGVVGVAFTFVFIIHR
jgi:hypothetical protein